MPFLYNSRPRKVSLGKYQPLPASCYIKHEDPGLPPYYFDPLINPISAYNKDYARDVALASTPSMTIPTRKPVKSTSKIFNFHQIVSHFLSEEPLFHENTVDAYSLLHSTYPFNKRSGRMKRMIDIPLVKRFYREHCPRNFPTKVKVSYQKLLKVGLNELHKKERPPKMKRSLLRSLKMTKFFQTTTLDCRSRFTGLSTRP